MTELDDRDRAILEARRAQLDTIPGPRVGDWVHFSDGTERRISHDWGDEVQTSDGRYGSSFYLGNGYASFSGGLYGVTAKTALVDTGKTRSGTCWIFHHDYQTAGGGVDTFIPFRVYACNEAPPS